MKLFMLAEEADARRVERREDREEERVWARLQALEDISRWGVCIGNEGARREHVRVLLARGLIKKNDIPADTWSLTPAGKRALAAWREPDPPEAA